MNTNEEYLDELLKSIEPITNPEGINDDEVAEESVEQNEEMAMDSDYVEDLSSDDDTGVTQEEEQAFNESDLSNENESDSLLINDEEEHLGMSEEEINALLNEVQNSTDNEEIEDSTDVKELLKQFTDDEDLSDIQSILDKNDNDEVVDTQIIDESQEDIDIPQSILSFDEDNTDKDEFEENNNAGELGKKNRRRNKKKREDKEKKTGLFTKIINALTEEDEELKEEAKEDGKQQDEVVITEDLGMIPEKTETGITDENLQILDELSKEDNKKDKKLKKKSKRKKKGDGEEQASAEESDDENAKGKGKKKNKPKKEKKEKQPKTQTPRKPEKKLPKKRVIVTFAFCFTILAIIIIMSFVIEGLSNIREARWAFDNEDYITCYENLYGLDLNEENQSIYNKSETILILRKKLSSYENYKRLGMDLEALNALFDGVRMYPQIQERAEEYQILDRVENIYNSILAKFDGYGLTQTDVAEILAYDSKVKYTKRLQSIVDGTPFVYEDDIVQQEETVQEQTIDEILPEEEDFLPEDPNSIFETDGEIIEDNSDMVHDTDNGNDDIESNEQDNQPVRVGSNSTNKGTRVTSDNMNVSSEVKDGSVVIDNNE